MSFSEILTTLFTPVRLLIENIMQDDTIKNTVFGGNADLFQVLVGFLLISLLISALLRPVRLHGSLAVTVGSLIGSSVEHVNRSIKLPSSDSHSSLSDKR